MRKSSSQKGYILAILIITVLFVTVSITYVTSLSLTTYNLATRDVYKSNAQMTADAALDIALSNINTSGIAAYSSTYSNETDFLSSGNMTTTYQIAVIDGASSDKKTLAVIARTKIGGNTKITRRYEVDIQEVTSGTSGSSVVSGVGGLILKSNAKISGGDVIVNGTITMSNNSQIGLSTTPLANAINVRVAHTNCPNPVDSTYPRVCAPSENGEPISMGNTAKIYADVRATNQTTSTKMSKPGLIPNQTVAPTAMPNYDRQYQKDHVDETISSSAAACSGGSKTWQANTKITGNVTVSNGCTVTINGNVWITGRLNVNNNATIKVADSLGATSPVIMVDGATSGHNYAMTINNNGILKPNSSGTGMMIITYWSAASCSPDCTDVTGTDLANSQTVQTVDLSNNGSASKSILYARWSLASIDNNGTLGAVAGQTVQLSNNAVINFTSSVPGSDNQTSTWTKRGYMRVYQ